MPKTLSTTPKYLAPDICGYKLNNESNDYVIWDEKKNCAYRLDNIDDKIIIYERQVKKWFLERASRLKSGKYNGFTIMMIGTSYIEGVEQYKTGSSSHGQSKTMFKASFRKIFYDVDVTESTLNNIYSELRCGLFHSGMSGGRIVLDKESDVLLRTRGNIEIIINPDMFLDYIKKDFNKYIADLSNVENVQLREYFSSMFILM